MNAPWLELDKWAYDIETGAAATGNRIRDSRKHAAILRAAERIFRRHVREHSYVTVSGYPALPPRHHWRRMRIPGRTGAVEAK